MLTNPERDKFVKRLDELRSLARKINQHNEAYGKAYCEYFKELLEDLWDAVDTLDRSSLRYLDFTDGCLELLNDQIKINESVEQRLTRLEE